MARGIRYTEDQYRILINEGLDGINEKVWQTMVCKAASEAGWLFYHTYDSRKSQKGFPDLVLVRPPDVLFVELKTQTGDMSPDQRVWQQWLSQCPQIEYAVWRPQDYKQITERLWQGTQQ